MTIFVDNFCPSRIYRIVDMSICRDITIYPGAGHWNRLGVVLMIMRSHYQKEKAYLYLANGSPRGGQARLATGG